MIQDVVKRVFKIFKENVFKFNKSKIVYKLYIIYVLSVWMILNYKVTIVAREAITILTIANLVLSPIFKTVKTLILKEIVWYVLTDTC